MTLIVALFLRFGFKLLLQESSSSSAKMRTELKRRLIGTIWAKDRSMEGELPRP